MSMRLILASGSPRRKEILSLAGLTFAVMPSDKKEKPVSERPEELVKELSLQKAADIAWQLMRREGEGAEACIIGSDTVVALDGQVLGKPKDEADAVRMLSLLQGRAHQVYTGVTVLTLYEGCVRRQKTFYEETGVEMYPMSREEIIAYVATGEPMDKAGSYAVQGRCAVYIKGISGDYYNVVGLPVARLRQECPDIFVKEEGTDEKSGSI